jgi:hypothetical protein
VKSLFGAWIDPVVRELETQELPRKVERTMNKKTPYEQGLEQGRWSAQQVEELGFASPQECLLHQEAIYEEKKRDLLPSLHAIDPAYAEEQAEFLEGLQAATRSSLKGMA